jgi:hypothetical protein
VRPRYSSSCFFGPGMAGTPGDPRAIRRLPLAAFNGAGQAPGLPDASSDPLETASDLGGGCYGPRFLAEVIQGPGVRRRCPSEDTTRRRVLMPATVGTSSRTGSRCNG